MCILLLIRMLAQLRDIAQKVALGEKQSRKGLDYLFV
jgi:hypothetical protein